MPLANDNSKHVHQIMHAIIDHNWNFIQKLRPWQRAVMAIIGGLLSFFAVRSQVSLIASLVISWSGFALVYLAFSWLVFFTLPINRIKHTAQQEDGSRFFVYFMIILSSLASMVAVLALITSSKHHSLNEIALITIEVLAMILSWALVHTIFTFHYARIHYRDDNGAGLKFPDDSEPDYLDFAYFAFCVGCTFQVSDVESQRKEMRKVILLHSLLSFWLNAFVVALTINIIAGLRQ